MSGFHFSLQRGSMLIFILAILAALALTLWAYRQTLPPLSRLWTRLLAALRFGAIALIILLLFDPLLSFESTIRVKPNVVVLVDYSASMGIVDPVPDGGEELMSRADIASRLLDDRGAQVLQKLGRRYDTAVFPFAAALLSSAEEAEFGGATNIALALEGAVDAEWERGVDALVIVSDGISNAGKDPIAAARDLGVPIYPIAVGDPTPSRDLSIQQVLSNRVVYVNSRVVVEVHLRAKGFAGETVLVRIREGERTVAEQEVSVRDRRESIEIPFSFRMDREGIHRYTVEVPFQTGELIEENNSFLFTLEAVKEKIKVLFLADRPGWDFRFLKRVLDTDPNLNVDYFVQNSDGSPGPLGGGAGSGFPHSLEELVRYDLVALAGVPAVAGRDWGATLDRYVRARGGALLFLAFDPIDGMVPERLADLLPVQTNRRRDKYRLEPFGIKMSHQGERHPVLRLHRDEKRNRTMWEELPPLTGANLLGPIRPGTALLASHPRYQVDGKDVPVFALGSAGKGRVFLANGSGFWKWDFRMWGVGKTNRTYKQFWSNLVRWMVARGGFRNVTVKPENITYNRGEPIVFRGLVMSPSLEPVSDARVEVVIDRAEGESDRFFLASDGGDPGAYEKTIESLPPGDYTYTASVATNDALLGEDSGEFSVSEFSAEFLETERDDALLAALAQTSGGRVFSVEELGDWQGDLSLESRTHITRTEKEIWNHPLLFLGIIGLFTTEWFIRKRKGLS